MTDFSTWNRKTLEEFAAQANDENRALRADLKLAIAGWRWAAVKPPAPIMGAAFVESLLREGGGPAFKVLPGEGDQLV